MGNSFASCGNIRRIVPTTDNGSETVQPVVNFYLPKKTTVYHLPEGLMNCEEDAELVEIMKQGMDSIMQLCVLCSYASKNNFSIRAVGSGASSSRLTSARDILVDMKKLNRILTPPPVSREGNMSKDFVDVEVEGGMLLDDFVKVLDNSYGLGLPTICCYTGHTVAGAAMTSSHGSGYFSGTMSTSVVGLHLITCRGVQVRIELGDETFEQCQQRLKDGEPCGNPVVLKSTDLIQGAVVSLGSLGIVYSITYRCVPVFKLEEKRKLVRVSWSNNEGFRIKDRLSGIFTDPNKGEFFSFFIKPYPEPRRFLYASILQSKRTDASTTCCWPCICWCGPGGRGCTDCGILQNKCTLCCLYACTKACPARIPDITNFGLSFYDRDEYPFVHKYYNVLKFTNLNVRTAEWCLPLDNLDAALGDVIEAMNQHAVRHGRYSVFPVHVRIAKTDHLLLSPANRQFSTGETNHCCFIEVPILPGGDEAEDYISNIEDTLFQKYKARPNWAKPNRLDDNRVKQLYPDFPKWQELYRLLNKDGTFCNEFTTSVGFDNCLREIPDDVNDNVVTVQPALASQ